MANEQAELEVGRGIVDDRGAGSGEEVPQDGGGQPGNETRQILTATQSDNLRKPFEAKYIGKLPRQGVKLDYVGHAAVTSRLLEVDPLWNWEPVAVDADGFPKFELDTNGKKVGLWIRLTICGVTRLGFGSVAEAVQDAEKQLIGDAIRNAAMRFGVALDLWIKQKEEEHAGFDQAHQDRAARNPANSAAIGATVVKGVTKKLHDAGADEDDIKAVVHDATSGRTTDMAEILKPEVTSLNEAVKTWIANRPPPEDEVTS